MADEMPRADEVTNLTPDEVAAGFVAVANEAMCRPIRALTQMRGPDLSTLVLSCFGGAGPQLAGSAVTGLVSAVVAAPVNVVRTRVMNDLRYGGRMLDCAVQLVRAEGAAGLFKGFVPTLHRQVIFNMTFWMALEELQRRTGQERL